MSVREGLSEIRLQVMWARLLAVVEDQARTLMATAFSATVREAGDLSAGVFDTRGRMIAQAVTGTPGHVNSMAEAVPHFLAKYPIAALADGDHLVCNDPWLCSGHLHDLTVVSPVFLDGRPVALFACTCHVLDIGGIGQVSDGRSVFEEGLHIPIMHLARGGEINRDLMEIVTGNVRTPREVEGDILSYVTANEASAAELRRMMAEFDLDALDDLADYVIERSRSAMIAEIRALPKGRFANRLVLDGLDAPVELAAELSIAEDAITVDFAGTSRASAAGINVVMNYCKAYATYGVRCVVGAAIPNNHGSLAPVAVTAPEGSILNAPRPYPVAARHIIGQFLPDVVLGCLAQAVPDRVPAEGAATLWGAQIRGGPEVDAAFGHDGEAGQGGRRYEILFFNSGGTGARPGSDGLSATAFPSGVRAISSEVVETLAPIVIWRKELRPDSAGPGRRRGGFAQTVEIGSIDGAPFAISAMFDRIDNAARGRDGGGDGAVGRIGLASGAALAAKGLQYVAGDDRVRLELPGGGGFGPAPEREPERVAEDVRNGLVSPERAEADYGVTISDEDVPAKHPG